MRLKSTSDTIWDFQMIVHWRGLKSTLQIFLKKMENPNNEEKGFFCGYFSVCSSTVYRRGAKKKITLCDIRNLYRLSSPFFCHFILTVQFFLFFLYFFWIYESQRVREKSSIKFSIYDVLFITSCVVNFMKTTWVLFRWVPRLWSSWETFVGWMEMFPHRCQPIIFIYY